VTRLEVVDRSGQGLERHVAAGLRDALERFQGAGKAPRRPVRAVLEDVGVTGFTETQVALHVVHLRAAAARAPWFPGLLLREVAHAALSDLGRASHDPGLLLESFGAARERSTQLRFLGLVGALNHHVRDVYADDLAASIEAPPLLAFLRHTAEAAARPGASAGEAAVEAGYALGTLVRRGAAVPRALQEAVEGNPTALRLADGFAALPPDPEEEDLVRAVVRLVGLLPVEA
jgi:hypothetical protein